MGRNNDSGTATVYAVPAADALSEAEYRFFLDFCTSSRKVRVSRLLRREDACRSVVAGALLQYIHAEETGRRFDDTSIASAESGKPAFTGSSMHFNLSHSGSWVVCAVHTEEIGVDIERRHHLDIEALSRFFSPAEIAFLRERPAALREKTFFEIWTLKEGYVKSFGKGLSCPLDRFSCIPSDDGGVQLVRHDSSLPEKHFAAVNVDDGYSCMVCLSPPGAAIATAVVRPTELMAALRTLP